jgi:pimeloyl-ACP methyl ester carboxylesterase
LIKPASRIVFLWALNGGDVGDSGVPVVFVHGLWLHASSWEQWTDCFREEGYLPAAPGWPGELATVRESREKPEAVAGFGLSAIADHYRQIIGGLQASPVLIGHSIGGLIVQRLLAGGHGIAGISIDAPAPRGVFRFPPSSSRVASYALRNPANRSRRAVSLSDEQFRYAFANAVSEFESESLYDRWAIPSPGRPLFEVVTANLSRHSPAAVDTDNPDRGPLLLMAGARDRTVPASVVAANYRLYRRSRAVTEFLQIPERGHSLTIDSHWEDVGGAALTWLRSQSL